MTEQDTERGGNEDCILEAGARSYAYTNEALKAGGGNSQPANLSKAKTFKEKKWYAAPFIEARKWDDAKWAKWVDILFAGRHQDLTPPAPNAPPKDYVLYVHKHLPDPDCRSKLMFAFREKVSNLGDKTPKWVHSLPELWLPQ